MPLPMPTLPPGVKLPSQLWPSGQRWAEYQEVIPEGISAELARTPAFWQKVALRLNPFDVIECIAADGAFALTLRVASKSVAEGITFRVERETTFDEPIRQKSIGDKYRVKQARMGWVVLSVADGKVVAEGLDEAGADAERDRLIAAATAG